MSRTDYIIACPQSEEQTGAREVFKVFIIHVSDMPDHPLSQRVTLCD